MPITIGKHDKLNNLDVFARMIREDNKTLQIAPFSSILRMQKVKAGAQITIGVPEAVMYRIMNNECMGGFLVVDKNEVERVKAEMQEEADYESDRPGPDN